MRIGFVGLGNMSGPMALNLIKATTRSSCRTCGRLELLRELAPGLSRVAFLWNPDVRGNLVEYRETEAAARTLRLELHSIEFSRAEDLDRAFSAVTSERAQALILPGGNPVAVSDRSRIASFAQRNRLPTMFAVKEYVDAGGLMSYGPSIPDNVPTVGDLRRQDPQGREGRRASRGAADQIRAGDQSQNGEGPGAHDPAVGARAS